MRSARDEIVLMIVDKVGVNESAVTDGVDIDRQLGCTGDDFHELMEEFAKRFNVDMTTYRWYFHTEEEGFGSPGSWFFKPPNERVERIPITPKTLQDAVALSRWPIVYPEHEIPKHRWDLKINGFLILVMLIFLIVKLGFWLFT